MACVSFGWGSSSKARTTHGGVLGQASEKEEEITPSRQDKTRKEWPKQSPAKQVLLLASAHVQGQPWQAMSCRTPQPQKEGEVAWRLRAVGAAFASGRLRKERQSSKSKSMFSYMCCKEWGTCPVLLLLEHTQGQGERRFSLCGARGPTGHRQNAASTLCSPSLHSRTSHAYTDPFLTQSHHTQMKRSFKGCT